MRLASREHGQILILLAAWLFFGGGASSALVVYDRPAGDIEKSVKQVVTDAPRRDAILFDINYWESGQEKLDKKVRADREELFKTLRRKDARRADVRPITERLDATLAEMDRSFLDLRFRVQAQVTNGEWTVMVARPEH
jgi:hypothetical protein